MASLLGKAMVVHHHAAREAAMDALTSSTCGDQGRLALAFQSPPGDSPMDDLQEKTRRRKKRWNPIIDNTYNRMVH